MFVPASLGQRWTEPGLVLFIITFSVISSVPQSIFFPSDVIASRAHFPEFVLLMFGWHFQQPVDESRLVFDPLRVVPDGLAEKPLDMGLKLLPSLIRCLLIHALYPLFFSEDDGCFTMTCVPLLSGLLPSSEQLGSNYCNVPALKSRCIELVFARHPFSVASGDRGSPVR